MKNNLKKNFIYNLAYQVLVMLVPLVTTPYISRVLGAENIGIYSYTLSISAYFILFGTIGTNLYAQRQIAFFQKDRYKYSTIFWEVLLLRLMGMLMALVLFFSCFVIRNNQYSLYYSVLLIELLGAILDISWLFQGLEQFKITVFRNSLVKIISIIMIFMFVKTKYDLLFYFLIYAISIIGGNLSLWFSLKKNLTKVSMNTLKPLKHLAPSIILFVPQMAIQIYTILDRTMLGYLIVDKKEVGFYDQGQKLIKTMIAIVTALGTVMLPRMASKFSEGDHAGIREYIYKSFKMVCMISIPMSLGIFSVADSFVPLFFGDGYSPVILLLRIISPVIFFIGFSNVIGVQFLLPTKREKQYTISVICGALINFAVNVLLIPKFGAFGASVGTVIAEAAVATIQIIFIRKEIKIIYILKDICNYLLAGMLMMVTCFIIQNIIGIGTICVILQVVIGTLVYGLVLLIVKDDMMLTIIPKKIRKR